MRWSLRSLLVVLAFSAATDGRGQTIVGKVVHVADGDTLTVLDRNHVPHKIRLYGIDAPETGQAFGTRSRQNLSSKVFGKTVRVQVVDHDKYGRNVGRVFLGGRSINMEQVRDGYAWDYRHYDNSREFGAAQSHARAGGRGLWADKSPTPPWEYRHNHEPIHAAGSHARRSGR